MTTKILRRVGVMLDIESLALRGARIAITQLAFVAFDLDDPETVLREAEEYLPIQPQLSMGRTIDADTVIWWLSNPEVTQAARDKFKLSSGDDLTELEALVTSVARKIEQAIDGADEVEIWARGPQFDVVNIESLFRDLGIPTPWKYDSVRDLRTVMSAAGVSKKDVEMAAGLVPHHAMSDCRYQIDCLIESWRRLRAKA